MVCVFPIHYLQLIQLIYLRWKRKTYILFQVALGGILATIT